VPELELVLAKYTEKLYSVHMKKILLENTGNFAIVDDDDYEYISSFGKWHENDSGYAVKRGKFDGRGSTIRMHTVVNKTPKRLQTDHINHNRLDNRKSNLRTTTQAMNTWNMQERKNGKKYDLPRGITYDIQRKKYVARKVTFKRFNTKDEAINYIKGEQREWK
jgi:hypothetical protein